jgi:beta-N-acetylhexosaminidase
VLVAHVRYRALDADNPASLSTEVVSGLLRRRLGFDGLILSDDLEMAAVAETWGVAEAARRFLGAGGDLALICKSAEARDEAVARIGRDIERGLLDVSAVERRRRAIRRLIDAAGPRPELSVIGCAEHRALAEEVARRSAEPG